MKLKQYLFDSARVLDSSAQVWSQELVDAAVSATTSALVSDRALLVCGNGGSASDAMHITGELVGRFLLERKALRAICLSANPAVLTARANDYSFDTVFSRQVEAYGQPGGVLLGISTSGNSKNVMAAFEKAKSMGMTTIAFTGQGGGNLAPLSDHLFAVPSCSTPFIQQVHICLYHYFCQKVEAYFASDGSGQGS